MKSVTIISAGIISLAIICPAFASAEGKNSEKSERMVMTPPSGEVEAIPAPKLPMMRNNEDHMLKVDSTISPREPKDRPSIEQKKPEGEAREMRGMATGTKMERMMASGTRPLPPKLEERMEKRDEKREGMMGSGAPKDCIAGATGTDCVGRGEERREEMQKRKDDRKSEMDARKAARQGEILKHMATQMTIRLEAAIDRLNKLATRLDSRIAKMKAAGVNTNTAEANLAIARTKITEAATAVALAKTNINNAVATASASSSPVGDAGKMIRDIMQSARESIEAANKALVAAVSSLKGGPKDDAAKGTSSPLNQ